MAWEKRGKRTYLYTKKRVGKRVISTYIGKGDRAKSHLAVEAILKTEQEIERKAEQERRAEDKALEAAMVAATEISRLMTEATLLASGCYQHHRQWRKKRETRRVDAQ